MLPIVSDTISVSSGGLAAGDRIGEAFTPTYRRRLFGVDETDSRPTSESPRRGPQTVSRQGSRAQSGGSATQADMSSSIAR